MKRWFFPFRQGDAEVPEAGPELLGAKGANLAEMCRLQLPVPPGFTISMELCRRYLDEGALPAEFEMSLREGIALVEAATNRRLGDARRPLLVSARSGAAVSMPGMLDTVLNLGLNATSVQGLVRHSGNPRFAYDSHRRFIAMFGDVVCGVPRVEFDKLLDSAKSRAGIVEDYEMDARSLEQLTRVYLDLFERRTGRSFPMDPYVQLREAIQAVFRSWESERAKEYRRIQGIDDRGGTAVTIQAMVFGNSGGSSGTGVAFTRDPVSGADTYYIDFLFSAQGEDIVAGVRNPQSGEELARELPGVYAKLEGIRRTLETRFRDMQDIEFTVEDGHLYILQTRAGKRSPLAALRIAIDLVQEGLITRTEALERLREIDPDSLREARLAGEATSAALASAVSACSGVAAGRVALTARRAVELDEAGAPVILVREETSADDIAGMAVACGILTARGGRTSHAAVVARQMGIPCLVGCRDLRIDVENRTLGFHEVSMREGDSITLDARSGRVYAGALPIVEENEPPELRTIRAWIGEEGMGDHPLASPEINRIDQ